MFTNELGALKGFKAKLHAKPDAAPKFHEARPIPFALKKPVEAELQRLEDEGIISPVQFSSWAAPIVPVVKRITRLQLIKPYNPTHILYPEWMSFLLH